MNATIRIRLCAMMFLQYFIWGAWYVTLGTWLGTTLKFSGAQIGMAAGTTAIGAIVSPFFVGVVADRSVATQNMLAVLHVLGAGLLLLASSQQEFTSFYLLVLAYSMCYMPTLALTNSLAMRQMRDPKAEFGAIRVLGTLGWIVAGLIVGGMGLEATALPMRIAAACSLAMGVYCLSLPHTPPLAKATAGGAPSILSRETLEFTRSRSMLVFVLASFAICIPLQFYYAFTNLFLNEIGTVNAAGKMTGGQMSEVLFMLLIPWFFRRLGVKYMLAVGMLAWVARYVLFAYGNSVTLVWMLWGGILLHGICYDFFFVTGQIYVDQQAPPALRASAQGFITLVTYGVGMFVGSWLSGRVVDAHSRLQASGLRAHDWRAIWLFAAAFAAIVLIVFSLSFAQPKERSNETR
jgi:nucleoside transporter